MSNNKVVFVVTTVTVVETDIGDEQETANYIADKHANSLRYIKDARVALATFDDATGRRIRKTELHDMTPEMKRVADTELSSESAEPQPA